MKPERPISPLTWALLPKEACAYIESLEAALIALSEEAKARDKVILDQGHRIERLEARLNRNSSNSSKPPSSDSPFTKPKAPQKDKSSSKKKRGAQKGHAGHRRVLLNPTAVVEVKPDACPCGHHGLDPCSDGPFYVQQCVELPPVVLEVVHYHLYKAICPCCGRVVKARIPQEARTGYRPRLCALIAQLSGVCGESRETVRDFLLSVFGLPISTGAIQRIIDRASAAVEPLHRAIGVEARSSPINHVDETSWFTEAKLKWLWVMTNRKVAWFRLHRNRSEQAFLELIGDWDGILVSDAFSFYRKWTNLRQTCLAHLLRRARGLAERGDAELAYFGQRLVVELSLLCHWADHPPSVGEWRMFYARLVHLLFSHEGRKDDAGRLARHLIAEMDSLWVFLEESGVEPTNNRAERALRYGVTWRKRSLGTQSEKGDRWVERILSVKQTCRMHGIPTFPILVQAISDYLKEQPTDVAWIAGLT